MPVNPKSSQPEDQEPGTNYHGVGVGDNLGRLPKAGCFSWASKNQGDFAGFQSLHVSPGHILSKDRAENLNSGLSPLSQTRLDCYFSLRFAVTVLVLDLPKFLMCMVSQI